MSRKPLEAFYTNDKGQKIRVVAYARDRKSRSDEVYYPKDHGKKKFVNARGEPVHFVIGGPSTHADLADGPGLMLRKSRRQNEKTETSTARQIEPVVDKTRGVRINLDTGAFSSLYNDASSAYVSGETGLLTLRDQDLKSKELFNAYSTQDIVDLMPRIGPRRWKDGNFVHRTVVRIVDAFARYPRGNDDSYWRQVIRQLGSKEPKFTMIEFRLKHPAAPPSTGYKDMAVYAEEIEWGAEDDGRKRTIKPKLYLPYWAPGHYRNKAQSSLMVPGNYFITGYPTCKRVEHWDSVTYYFNMTVRSENQIGWGDLKEISREADEIQSQNAKKHETLLEHKPEI